MRSLPSGIVLNTRPLGDAEDFSQLLHNAGLQPWEFPTITLIDLPFEPNVAAFLALDPRSFLIFSSANGVRSFARAAAALGRASVWEKASKMQSIVIGQKTAKIAAEAGLSVVFVAVESNSEGLGAEFIAAHGDQAVRHGVALLRGRAAGVELAELLTAAKIPLVPFELYDSQRPDAPPGSIEKLRRRFLAAEETRRFLTFMSSRACENFFEMVARYDERWLSLETFAIGKKTEHTLHELGFQQVTIPEQASAELLVAGILKALDRQGIN